MSLKKGFAAIFLTIFIANQSLSQTICPSQPPTIRGFNLGMSNKSAQQQYPKLKIPKKDINGVSEIYLDRSNHSEFEEVFSEKDREGIRSINLVFFENRLVKLTINYDGFTEWKNVTELTDAIASTLILPAAEKWNLEDENTRHLICNKFAVIVRLEPKRGTYEVQKPSLYLYESDIDAILEKRKQTEEERKKKSFKP